MDVAEDPNDPSHFFVTSYGTGLYEFRNNTLYAHYTPNNSILCSAVKHDPNYYTRTSNAVFDKENRLWITVNGDVDTTLVCFLPDGTQRGLNFYANSEDIFDLDFETKFKKHTNWNDRLTAPYVVSADEELVEKIGKNMIKGVTISAPGFYGPQGRFVRLAPNDLTLNEKITSFRYGKEMITNFEMESSALAGLARLLGHKAMTVCAIIAGRVSKDMNTEYKGSIEELIKIVLERI
jgi:hypothetical protein